MVCLSICLRGSVHPSGSMSRVCVPLSTFFFFKLSGEALCIWRFACPCLHEVLSVSLSGVFCLYGAVGADHPPAGWSAFPQRQVLSHPHRWCLQFPGWPRGGSRVLVSVGPPLHPQRPAPNPRWRAPRHRRALQSPSPCPASRRRLVSLAELPTGPRWRKPDRNQAPCASAPGQVLPAPRPLGHRRACSFPSPPGQRVSNVNGEA